jgi:DNA-binding MurR/RpiR family transcriptional regulator
MAIRTTTADLIETTWPSMTKTDREVAGVLLSQDLVVGLQALAEVLAKTVIHTRSIIRCAKKLSFVCCPKYQSLLTGGSTNENSARN